MILEIPPGQLQPGCDQPLGLGGYQVMFSFDRDRLEYLGAAACPGAPPELGSAVSTNPPVANSIGAAGILAQTPVATPIAFDRACLASVRLRARSGDPASTTVRFGYATSLGLTILSAGITCGAGPTRIAANDGDVVLQVGASEGDPTMGDVTLDGTVDVRDAVTLSSCLVGNTKSGAAPFVAGPSAADLNADRTLDVLDLVDLMAQIVRGR